MTGSSANDNPIVLLRRLHRWRMAFLGLVILLAGITLGVAGTLLLVQPAERQPPVDMEAAVNAMLGRFRQELRITREQAEQIRRILWTRMSTLHEIRIKARPEIEAQLAAMKKEIGAVLTEEQRSGWQDIIGRIEGEFQRGLRRGPGGPGGGFYGGRERPSPPGGPPWRPDERRLRRRGPGGEMLPAPPNAPAPEPNVPDDI